MRVARHAQVEAEMTRGNTFAPRLVGELDCVVTGDEDSIRRYAERSEQRLAADALPEA